MATSQVTKRSKGHRLLDLKLKDQGMSGLSEFVRSGREEGTSWFDLAVRIREITGESISDQTLRVWFKDEVAG